MNEPVVALMRCDSYDEERVRNAVEEGIKLLGGIDRFMRPNERIVMKPNVLFGTNPDKCITTHPIVFGAVGGLLKRAGADVYYGDSPAIGSCERHVRRAQLEQPANALGIKLADFNAGRAVTHKEAHLSKHFVIANGVLDSDGLVSLPKLKSHPLTRLTGAIKNQFGCIPGILKYEQHVKMPDPYDFSAMLVDINMFIRPRLCVMDGIMAMEGNGPRNGVPKNLGVLLFSNDPVALDSIACKIVGLDPECCPPLSAGEKAGLGTYHYDRIEVVGERVEKLIDTNFDVIRTPPMSSKGSRARVFLRNRLSQRPVIDTKACSRCGTCVNICPVDPKAVDWTIDDKSRPPVHRYGECIRCYCCQESCPDGAISARDTVLGRLFQKANIVNRI